MNILTQYGWGTPQQQFFSSITDGLLPGRVTAVHGFKYHVMTAEGELETELSGKLLFENENEFLPKVGDWVLFTAYDKLGYLVSVFPRQNALSRKTPGKKTDVQVLAANVDYAVIVQGLDDNFNLMRLDRYIVQIQNCGIRPIVVLNKADLVSDRDYFREQVQRLHRDVPVYFCSAVTREGIDEIKSDVFRTGMTFVLIGSSGVGKSSLLNTLLGKEEQTTGNISDSNQKGRHTTTARELFLLEGGALVIDTPGMREFGLTSGSDADSESFPTISELAGQCRYGDCRHIDEAGCAVLKALEDHALDTLVYDSYLKLIREQRRFTISATEKKQQARQFGRILKEANRHRRKYKF